MDVYIGTVIPWALPSNKIPTGWHLCDGSLLNVQQYTALYAILGTKYGGNGTTTFNLPDLRNRMVTGEFQPGAMTAHTSSPPPVNNAVLPSNGQGSISASGSVSLTAANLPQHTHNATFTPSGNQQITANIQIPCNTSSGSLTTPSGNYIGLGTEPSGEIPNLYQTPPVSGTATLASFNVTVNTPPPGGTVTNQNTGGTAQVTTFTGSSNNIAIPINPVITCNFIIATVGYFPPRP